MKSAFVIFVMLLALLSSCTKASDSCVLNTGEVVDCEDYLDDMGNFDPNLPL